MRLLWISFLLIGSITCAPSSSGSGDKPQLSWWYGASGPQQEQIQPSYQYPSGTVNNFGGYSSPGFYYSSGPSSTGGAGSGSIFGAQQISYQGGHLGAPGDDGSFQVGDEGYSSSSDPDEHEPEFTPVSDHDVVYAKKSRSRYGLRRYRVATFHYNPTQSVVVHPPMFPYPEGKPVQGQDPVKNS